MNKDSTRIVEESRARRIRTSVEVDGSSMKEYQKPVCGWWGGRRGAGSIGKSQSLHVSRMGLDEVVAPFRHMARTCRVRGSTFWCLRATVAWSFSSVYMWRRPRREPAPMLIVYPIHFLFFPLPLGLSPSSFTNPPLTKASRATVLISRNRSGPSLTPPYHRVTTTTTFQTSIS